MNTTRPGFRRLDRSVGPILGILGAVLAAGCAAPRVERQIIKTPDAPSAIGPYSQAVFSRGVLYVSGQIALDPRTGQMVGGSTGEQTRQVMHNLRAILTAAGLGFEDVVQAQVFLADLNDFGAMNEIYATHFTVPPARITIQAARLPRDAKVEIAVIAGRREGPATQP